MELKSTAQITRKKTISVVFQYRWPKGREATYLDGCNQWQTFYKVMFPLTGTSVAALTIFTAVFAYGDLMWPLLGRDIWMSTMPKRRFLPRKRSLAKA